MKLTKSDRVQLGIEYLCAREQSQPTKSDIYPDMTIVFFLSHKQRERRKNIFRVLSKTQKTVVTL